MNINDILSQLGESEISKIGSQAGLDNNQVNSALQGALPAIIAGLKGNAQGKMGQKQLEGALERDHDGSLFDNLSSFLDNPRQAKGKEILNHTFASRRTVVEDTVSKKAGISSGSMSKIMEIAAPLVMAYLGKQKKQSSSNGIGDILSSLFNSNANSSNDPTDNGLDVGDIASMFINSRKGGIGGFIQGFLGK